MSLNQYSTAGAQTMPGMAGAITASQESVPVRMAFLRKVYSLFSMSLLVWAGTAALIYSNESMLNSVVGLTSGMGIIGLMLIMFVAFGVLRVTAGRFPLNLLGLGIFAVIEGIITVPLVAYASIEMVDGVAVIGSGVGGLVLQAFLLTATIFGSLTAYVLITKKDFSFMRGALYIGLGLMFAMVILSYFGIGGGLVAGSGFAAAGVLLFAGFALYDTSNILRRYPANQATMAAATLLIDFVAMFRFILILLSNRN